MVSTSKQKSQSDYSRENRKKILLEIIKNVNFSCRGGKKEIDYCSQGEYLLARYEELLNYYSSSTDKEILKDLKKKLQGIQKWQLINYNKEASRSICEYLLKQEQNEEETRVNK